MKLMEVLMKLTLITRCRGAIQIFGPTRSGRDATRTRCRNTVRSDAHSVLHAFTRFAFPPSNVAFSCRRACGRLGTCFCLFPLNGSPLASVTVGYNAWLAVVPALFTDGVPQS